MSGGGAAEHPPRPPIPIAPLPTGRAPLLERIDVTTVVVAVGLPDGPLGSVSEVALAVDAGRATAAAAAQRGATEVAADGADTAAARDLAAWAPGGETGPLRALRRLGDAACAVACGVALGAGESGLAFVADTTLGRAGATIAVGVEPALAPRVRPAAQRR